MAAPGRTPAIIISALILVFGIIHLGVGSGIVGRYRQFDDIFRQPVGLAGFNIVIGIYGIAIGILGLVAVINENAVLSRSAAIAAGILGVFALISLIVALVLNGQAISYIRRRLTFRMTSYAETDNSITVMDTIQTKYQCCGVNLWLDWARVSLGVTTGTGIGTGIGTGTVIGTGTGTGTGTGIGTSVTTSVVGRTITLRNVENYRRCRNEFLQSSMLNQPIRQRRQVTSPTDGSFYGLPSTYGFNLPLSCCISGGSTTGQSVGGYCVFNAANGTSGFYIDGCMSPVANAAVSQIMGIGIINVCMMILAFVFLPVLIKMFPQTFNPSDPNNKQPSPDNMYQGQQQGELQQQQQLQQQPQIPYPNGGYYMTNNNAYGVPTYTVYQ